MVRRQEREPEDRASTRSRDDDSQLADRLDRLSVDDAERVLERAIALQMESDAGLGAERTMDRATLQRIAKELDIDDSLLEQALVEQVFAAEDDGASWIDRLVGPKTIREQGIAPLGAEDTQKVVDVWMERHEGLRKTLEVRGVADWEKDLSLGGAARRVMRMTDGTGRLREAPPVTTRVHEIAENRSAVVVEADSRTRRQTGMVGVGVIAFFWTIGFVAAIQSALVGDGADPRLAAVMVMLGGLFGGGFLLAARSWMNKTTKAVKMAVRAITNPASVRDSSFLGVVSDLVTEMTSLAGDIREEIRLRRRQDE